MQSVTIAVVFVYIALSTSGLMLLKKSLSTLPQLSAGAVVSLSTNVQFLCGFFCYAASFLTWLWLLSKNDVSSIYPTVVGLTYAVIVLTSVVFLGETFNAPRTIGVALVGVGVILLAR